MMLPDNEYLLAIKHRSNQRIRYGTEFYSLTLNPGFVLEDGSILCKEELEIIMRIHIHLNSNVS